MSCVVAGLLSTFSCGETGLSGTGPATVRAGRLDLHLARCPCLFGKGNQPLCDLGLSCNRIPARQGGLVARQLALQPAMRIIR